MSNGDFNWIANCIRGIAEDVFRGLHVRGKSRDFSLSKSVLRHRYAVLVDGKHTEKAG